MVMLHDEALTNQRLPSLDPPCARRYLGKPKSPFILIAVVALTLSYCWSWKHDFKIYADRTTEIKLYNHTMNHTLMLKNAGNTTLKDCILRRGSSGYWYYNETLARQTFYSYGFRSAKWARENQNNSTALYPGNSFDWRDTTLVEGCQSQIVTKTFFCETMEKLQVQRILLVGDSLMENQLESLVSLIGYYAGDFVKTSAKSEIRRRSIDCPHGYINVHYKRENLGPNLRETDVSGRDDASKMHMLQFGPEIPYCVDGFHAGPPMHGPYCPWHMFYNETTDKTLLVLNQGAHFHSVETFSHSFDQFVSLYNSLAHAGDIVVYRATVPGHKDCFGEKEEPIPIVNMTYDKFLSRFSTSRYDWNLFDEYNSYARRELSKIVPSVTTHYLNVYNMTVLRPDQHRAANDCLHYTHPGPIDFWNHLLLSNLADIANVMSSSNLSKILQFSV